MTPVEILHVIVSTEQLARSMYADAREKQAGLASYLEQEIARLREEIFAAVNAEIADIEREEIQRADKAIAALDDELAVKLEHSRSLFEAHGDEFINRLYHSVVNADA